VPHDLARQLLKIDSISKFRRDNKFPQSDIALLLPTIQGLRWRNCCVAAVETCGAIARCALASNIPTVSPPLTRYFALCVGNADGTPLIELFPRPSGKTGRLASGASSS
jgi:hypothetical protein